VLTVAQVFALADAFTDRRYRLLVLLAVFGSLRWGELAALPRYCVDTDAGIISVRASVVELARGPLVTGPTKSAAGNRDVTIPALLLPDMIKHLEDFTAADPRALVFTGPKGAQLRPSNFTRQWKKATVAAGLAGFHFHDLRHTGNTLAGEAGATLRELMDRMGHASTRAALIYQHRTTQRDRLIADEISKRAEAELKRSGTQSAPFDPIRYLTSGACLP
jgi:integrase